MDLQPAPEHQPKPIQTPSTDQQSPNQSGTAHASGVLSSPAFAASAEPAINFGTSESTSSGMSSKKSGFFSKFLTNTRAYVPEYILLLVVTVSLVSIVNGLMSNIVSYIGDPKPQTTWGGGWQYTYSLSLLAATLVLVPLLVILTKRIKGTEFRNETIKNAGWRKAFLGIFLLIVSLAALGYSIALVYQIISQIAGAGLVTSSGGIWKNYVRDIFAILLFGATTWLYARDYRYTDQDAEYHHQILAKIHRYGLTLIAIILAVVFNFTVLSAQRNDFIDNLITNDLNSIHSKIEAYESDHDSQVTSLDSLKLSEDITSRSAKYGYEYHTSSDGYKLCAVFKTDTSSKTPDDSSTSLEQTLNSSSDNLYPSTSTYADPSVHDKGRVCFSYQSLFPATTANPYSNNSSNNLFDSTVTN